MTPSPLPSSTPKRGSVLILTLFLLMAITSMALVLARSMRVEAGASASYVAQLQAQAVADGAIAYVGNILNGSAGAIPQDQDIYCQQVPLGDGYYWIIKHDMTTDDTYLFGLTDEAARINLNTIDVGTLSRIPLPGMTPDIAASIVAWRSPANGTNGGADSGYYLSLPTPYNSKNAPFETIEELLLVRGVVPVAGDSTSIMGVAPLSGMPTLSGANPIAGAAGNGADNGDNDNIPGLLYGEDTNRNGVLDPNEDINKTGVLQRGLADYVTVYSLDRNTDSHGNARININAPGVANGANSTLWRTLTQAGISSSRATTIASLAQTGQPFRNIIDFYYRCAMQVEEFQKVADRLTTSTATTVRGLINLNTASSNVLSCLSDMNQSDGDAIVSHRASNLYSSLADLIGVIPEPQAIAIGSLVTTRSYRCSADIVAVDPTGRSFKRYLVVFDTRSSPVHAIYYRDLTDLGWPLDPQILTDLQAGKTLATTATPGSSSNSMNPTGAP